ncbi:MAG TPA: restriction endonuclease subunit S [Phycisphaerales bacterium]|nr:restriction endonuclease subunit S [Phycisphaerales bacterium]
MTHDLKPYPEYKDSGVPWLGQVPAHWDIVTLRHVTNIQLSNVDKHTIDGELSVRLCNYTDVYYHRYITPDLNFMKATALPREIEKFKLQRGDVLITKDSEDWKDIAVPTLVTTEMPDVLCGYHLAQLRPDNGVLHGEYLMWTCLSESVALQFRIAAKGVTRYAVSGPGIKSALIQLPPMEEQQKIGRYLRDIDHKIHRFIRNRQRLIKVLNGQKQAIINRAVTRGLDPNVKLKPSGVEWLGNIPEHWEARRLRTLAAVRASGVDKNTNEDEVPVMLCNYVDVYKNDRITAAIDFMKATATPEEVRAFELKAGDVIITKDSESWDDIAIPTFVPEDLPGVVCAYHLALVRPFSEEIEGEFLFRAFLSDPVADQFRVAATGVTRFGLAQGVIKGAFFPLPPLEEQRAIIAYINEKYAEISQAISRAEREIDLIREYRTRLIADVVTGKVDVRGITAEQKKPAKVIQFRKKKEQAGHKANVHFRRAVFAAEIVARLHKEPTFGHVKFQKLIFLCEKKCSVDIGSTYYRQAAGPYDNRALHSIDSQMKKQKWYASQMVEGRYHYVPLPKAGGHKTYFGRYFSDIEKEFSNIIETFRKLDTERCEIVATLYSAWEDLLKENGRVSDDRIVHEVLTNWHESKKRIPRERWENTLNWMRQNGFVPGTMRQSGKTS